MVIIIKTNRLEDAVAISRQIPEFKIPYEMDEYHKRLTGRYLILTAYIDEIPVGFKIGYERNKHSFYSWMGGVLPKYRKKGIAEKLADYQEKWAQKMGYHSIQMKTRKKHQAMVAFSIKRGFVITEEKEKIPKEESRTYMTMAL